MSSDRCAVQADAQGGIELPEESISDARRRYRQDMQDQRAAEKGKKGEKAGDEVAGRMVDAAGGWLGSMSLFYLPTSTRLHEFAFRWQGELTHSDGPRAR